MNLKKNTQINGVMYYDKNSSIVVNSLDLNMSFESYVNSCNNSMKTSLNKMYSFNYIKGKTLITNEYVFTLFNYKDDRYTCSFIEIKELKNK